MGIQKSNRAILAAVLSTAFLAGCGQAPEEETESSAETRSVTHLYGTTDIPVDPQRVVVLDAGSVLEAVVALGVTPVGTVVPKSTGDFPAVIADRLPADVASMGNSEADVNLEAVVKANPDLIIVTSEDESQREFYDNVRDVAPTVAVSDQSNRWKETLADIAAHLGKRDEAARLLTDFDERVERVRTELGPDPGTASVVRVRSDRLNYMGQNGAFIWTTLREVGFEAPPGQDVGTTADSFFEVSLENTELLDADRIFVITDGNVDEPNEFLDTFRGNPLFQRLQGNIEYLPSSEYLFGNILKANSMLDHLEAG